VSDGGSAFEQDSDNDRSFARIPIGMWNLLARPYPWEANSPNVALAATENVLIIWLVACALGSARHVWSSVCGNRYLLFCTFTAIGLLVLLGQPRNAGLNSRERVEILPFLLAVLLATNVKRRLPSNFRTTMSSNGGSRKHPTVFLADYDVLNRLLRGDQHL
jgi:hypothetical protein